MILTHMSVLEIGCLIGITVIFAAILINMIVKKFVKKKKPKNDDGEEIQIGKKK